MVKQYLITKNPIHVHPVHLRTFFTRVCILCILHTFGLKLTEVAPTEHVKCMRLVEVGRWVETVGY